MFSYLAPLLIAVAVLLGLSIAHLLTAAVLVVLQEEGGVPVRVAPDSPEPAPPLLPPQHLPQLSQSQSAIGMADVRSRPPSVTTTPLPRLRLARRCRQHDDPRCSCRFLALLFRHILRLVCDGVSALHSAVL